MSAHTMLATPCTGCGEHRPTTAHDSLARVRLCATCNTGAVLPGPHGLANALRGCRCVDCLAMLADARDMVQRRTQGETLEAIGRSYGLTRERVRQLTGQLAPWKPWEAVKRERDIERRAIAAQRTQAKVPCEVCGKPRKLSRSQRFCSAECREVWNVLAYHVDENRREGSRKAVARWLLRNRDPDSVEAKSAKRLLNGDTVGTQGRWLVDGSETYRVAHKAFTEGWPVADRLPNDLREQLARDMAAAS